MTIRPSYNSNNMNKTFTQIIIHWLSDQFENIATGLVITTLVVIVKNWAWGEDVIEAINTIATFSAIFDILWYINFGLAVLASISSFIIKMRWIN